MSVLTGRSVGRRVSGRHVRIAKYAPRSIDDLYPGLREQDAVPVVYEIKSDAYIGTVVGLKWNDETAWIYEADVVEAGTNVPPARRVNPGVTRT